VLLSSPLTSSKSLTSLTLPVLSNNFDELDGILKLREEINMVGDGNCSVYPIMSQLYTRTYGGYNNTG
jgi:hypothetical protein